VELQKDLEMTGKAMLCSLKSSLLSLIIVIQHVFDDVNG